MAQPQHTNPDAVARAATERADKLAAEIVALKKQLEERAPSRPGSSVGIVAGQKTYRLTLPHYRRGRYYPAGESITVTDEKPSKSWVEMKAAASVEMVDVAATEKPNRPSDQQV